MSTPNHEEEGIQFESQLCSDPDPAKASTAINHIRFERRSTPSCPIDRRPVLESPVVVGMFASKPSAWLPEPQRDSTQLMFASFGMTGWEEGELIIPLNAFDETFSDEEIGRVVRLASRYAHWAQAETVAQLFNRDWDNEQKWRLRGFMDFGYEFNFERELAEPWADHSTEIKRFISRVTPILEGRNAEAGFIYCLHDGVGHYKIGRTKQLHRRLHQITTQPPFPIQLEFAFRATDAITFEAHLHDRLAEHRLRGEWFTLTKDQIAEVCREMWVETFFDYDGQPLPDQDRISRRENDGWLAGLGGQPLM